jgi:hypothetical protein
MSASPAPHVLQLGTPEASISNASTMATQGSAMTPVQAGGLLKNRKVWLGVGLAALVIVGVAVPVALTRQKHSVAKSSQTSTVTNGVISVDPTVPVEPVSTIEPTSEPTTNPDSSSSSSTGVNNSNNEGSEPDGNSSGSTDVVCKLYGDDFFKIDDLPSTVQCGMRLDTGEVTAVKDAGLSFWNTFNSGFDVQLYGAFNAQTNQCEQELEVPVVHCATDDEEVSVNTDYQGF